MSTEALTFNFEYKLANVNLDALREKYLCAICKDHIEKENPYFCYICQKLFHCNCLSKWDKMKQTYFLECPNCKNDLNLDSWKKKLDYYIDVELHQEINNLNRIIAKNKEENNKYQNDIERLNQELVKINFEYEKEHKKYNEHISELNRIIEKLKEENSKYKNDITELKRTIEENRNDIIKLNKTIIKNNEEKNEKYKIDMIELLKNIFNNIIIFHDSLHLNNQKIKELPIYLDLIKNVQEINISDLIYEVNEVFKLIIDDTKDELGLYFKTIKKRENKNEIDNISNEINAIFKNVVKQKEIRIFGKVFVENNKDKCKMVINQKEYDLKEKFYTKERELKIRLIGIENIRNISNLFSECENLYSLPDIHKIDTKNFNNMSFMFYKCSNLEQLPDVSQWDMSNVTNISGLFSGCRKLKILPDISKWDISKVKYLGGRYINLFDTIPFNNIEEEFKDKKIQYINDCGMFSNCTSLTFLPNISKWNTKNITNIESIFLNCSSLKNFPEISNWNISNVTSLKDVFSFCSNLKQLPDVSKWNTINVTNMENMFSFCSSLKSLPDISNWNTSNVTNMENMFSFCISLISLPDISNWNTSNVINMGFMFNYCSLIKSLPDISKWNTSNVKNMVSMFSFCSKLISLPDISKWDIQNVVDKKFMFHSCKKSLDIPEEFLD